MPDLPTPNFSITCGVCGNQLEHDGDAYQCYDCKLSYTSQNASADYADPEEEPCGRPYPGQNPLTNTHPFKVVRGDDGVIRTEQWRTTIREVGSCHLPASHTGIHDYPATGRWEYHDHDPRETQ